MKLLPKLLPLAVLILAVSFCAPQPTHAEPYHVHRYDRIRLTDVYYSEGANVGDFNRDGVVDVVYGPYWFAGPEYQQKSEIYAPQAQPRERYADNFFSWVYDFDQDGWNDVFVVGFPGTPAYVYQNPGGAGLDKHWPKHEVFDWVSNESPHFTDLVGDQRPELVCTRDGYFGYASIDWQRPLQSWKFHIISEQVAPKRFGHGLGVGDVDGDGRLDILMQNGWFQQPATLDEDPQWSFHEVQFAARGGAEMYAYDVDGDGDNDVITSLAAHEFGLAWYEQLRDGDKIVFRKHLIMGEVPEENRYGVVFSELHTVNLADMDGDGLKDIVTGKTYWSHHTQSPLWDAGAVVYWFKLVRGEDGVDWVPFQADDDSGVGRQVIVSDVNGDHLPDIVAGGMQGGHVLVHRRQEVDEPTWRDAQPKPRRDTASGLPPEDAAQQMTVPSGFRVQLAAGEPQIHQPIAMAIDHRGRLWVAEAYTYPLRAPEGEGKDKIIILEDTNGDGRLDSRKVFVEGLNLVSGLEVGFGGVWVGAAPYLMFIPDADGDDRPDGDPQILLDGFGYQDTHETLNAFIWGPDGWLYGCHGVFTHSRVGKPGTPEDLCTGVNAAVWRYHPLQHDFEVFAWGTSNPWGVDFNDHGQAFCTACVIPHLFHVVQGARYQRQGGEHFNPHVYDDIKTIADHAHYAGNIRDHAWWGHEPILPQDTSQAGGGHAHCGAMIYLGDSWPSRYRNQIFFNNIHGNRVNNDLLERQGSGFVGRHGQDLLLANDRWFRGINLRYGPDGSVYLIDWYDKNACHRRTPEIWDRTNGRVYRISYHGQGASHVKQTAANEADLSRLSSAELVALQRHRNDWYVRTARRLLQHRGPNPDTHRQLQELLLDGEPVPTQLRALWALHATHGFNEPLAQRMLHSSSEYVRAWTIQLQLEDRVASSEFMASLASLARQDSSPVVRLYLAAALQRLPLDQRWPIAEALLQHSQDAADHNLPLLYWYGVEPLVAADPERARALSGTSKIPLVSRHIARRAASDNATLDLVVAMLDGTKQPAAQQQLLDQMLAAFEGRVNIPMPPSWSVAYDRLAASKQADVRDRADQVAVILGDKRIFPRMRAVLVDAAAAPAERKRALEVLVRGRDELAAPSLQLVLHEPALRAAAIRALVAYADRGTPAAILAEYDQLNAEEKRDAIGTLVSRPPYALALLDAVQRNEVPSTDVHAYHIRQLLRFNQPQLTERIQQVWGAVRETSQEKQQQIARLKQRLTTRQLKLADSGNGRRLFNKTCASCHRLFGEGGQVGPEITGSNRANLDYILENVVDPSAVLGKDYRMTVIATGDGRIVSGLIQKETDSAVTVRTINDTLIVAKEDIEERQLSSQSLMPERLLDSLQPSEVRDLVAYLGSPMQVPVRGPRSPIDPQTKRVPGAIEGESMTIASKTAGNAGSQKMHSFGKDSWSGVDHLFWTGARPGARLELELPVADPGNYDLEIVLTRARDYGIVQLSLDSQKLGGPIDLFNSPDVITTGVLTFEGQQLAAGPHRLSVEVVGANPQAVQAYMFGLDYVRLAPALEKSVSGE